MEKTANLSTRSINFNSESANCYLIISWLKNHDSLMPKETNPITSLNRQLLLPSNSVFHFFPLLQSVLSLHSATHKSSSFLSWSLSVQNPQVHSLFLVRDSGVPTWVPQTPQAFLSSSGNSVNNPNTGFLCGLVLLSTFSICAWLSLITRIYFS